MKKISLKLTIVLMGCLGLSSCIDIIDPKSGFVTEEQATNAPGSYDKFVDAVTSTLAGQFNYSAADGYPFDFGYTSWFIARDVMGQDMALSYSGDWYSSWYQCSSSLGPNYMITQFPWTVFYSWIKNCNTVIKMAGPEPDDAKKSGAGIAYAVRAMLYLDIARMYAPKTYSTGKESPTVPIVTESDTIDLQHNPRATNERMYQFILSDLDKAEKLLANYQRSDKYTPDLSVVYGLKARTYLTMEDWPNAEKYAKLAQEGYSVLNESEYTDRTTGFNTPNHAWMFAVRFRATDPNITSNDGDSSWGTMMCLEVSPSVGMGYASNYGHQKVIDRHLYETIPATDFRKKVFVDFNIDNLSSESEKEQALSAYSNHPDYLISAAQGNDNKTVGGFSLKFRLAGGEEGQQNQYKGYLVSVPLMRVEEMKLIEAEAVGMQDGRLNEGIQLLTAFAKTRDPQYVYGTHNEAYGNISTSQFQNEVWWERRVELWGEGFATFDIKRLNKGIIRSYANTNHLEHFRWNTETTPDWMTLCITSGEADYNFSLENNPTPTAPTTDSPEHEW